MSDTVKEYTQQVIEEAPFPQENVENYDTSQQTKGQVYGAQVTPEQPLPQKKIAQELLSTALNTISKKILQTFELVQYGGLQIGKYVEGLSGDVRITPAGITGRDSSGNTTFGLDAETGNATFAGRLRAGATIVSNSIITEESSSGNGRTVYYNGGIPAIVIGDPS